MDLLDKILSKEYSVSFKDFQKKFLKLSDADKTLVYNKLIENMDNNHYQIKCNTAMALSLIAHHLNPEQQAVIFDFYFADLSLVCGNLYNISTALRLGNNIDLKIIRKLIKELKSVIETHNPNISSTHNYKIEPLVIYTLTLKYLPKKDQESAVSDILDITDNVLKLDWHGTFDHRVHSNIYRFATDDQKRHILAYAIGMLDAKHHYGRLYFGIYVLGENFELIHQEIARLTGNKIASTSLYRRAFLDGATIDWPHIQKAAITYICKNFTCCRSDQKDLSTKAIQACLTSNYLDVIKATLKGLQKCIKFMTNLQVEEILPKVVRLNELHLNYKSENTHNPKLSEKIILLTKTVAKQITSQYSINHTQSSNNVTMLYDNEYPPTCLRPSSNQRYFTPQAEKSSRPSTQSARNTDNAMVTKNKLG
jgi:hypothetical protein